MKNLRLICIYIMLGLAICLSGCDKEKNSKIYTVQHSEDDKDNEINKDKEPVLVIEKSEEPDAGDPEDEQSDDNGQEEETLSLFIMTNYGSVFPWAERFYKYVGNLSKYKF